MLQRIFLILFLFSAPASFAQTRGSYNPDEAPPSTDEYKNIPKGVLMPEDFRVNAQNVPEPESTPDKAAPAMTFEEVLAAYRAEKYPLIAQKVATLAISGHPGAEELLGIMYKSGQGVEKSPELAAKWLQKAADLNRPLAQHHLGTLYFTGEGVRQDPITALMWLHLAALYYPEGAEKTRALKDRDSIKAQVSRRDRDRAFEMAKEWLAKKGEDHLLKAE